MFSSSTKQDAYKDYQWTITNLVSTKKWTMHTWKCLLLTGEYWIDQKMVLVVTPGAVRSHAVACIFSYITQFTFRNQDLFFIFKSCICSFCSINSINSKFFFWTENLFSYDWWMSFWTYTLQFLNIWICYLGDRHAVGRQGQVILDLKSSAFDPKEKVWTKFPPEGSKYTPPHNSSDFKWKDYCPKVFRLVINPKIKIFLSYDHIMVLYSSTYAHIFVLN